jgi:hypothetical protein
LFLVDTVSGSWGSSLSTQFLSKSKSENILVDTITLDNFFYKKIKRFPSLIKIDVEGHELEVLEGCSKLIKEYKPYFIFEYAKHFIYDSIKQDPIDFLTKRGYKFYDCSTYKRINKIDLAKQTTRVDIYSNIIAIHSDKIDFWGNFYTFPTLIDLSKEIILQKIRNMKFNKYFNPIMFLKNIFFPPFKKKLITLKFKKDFLKRRLYNKNLFKNLCSIHIKNFSKVDTICFEIPEGSLPKSSIKRYIFNIKFDTIGCPNQLLDISFFDSKGKLISKVGCTLQQNMFSSLWKNIVFETNKIKNWPIKLVIYTPHNKITISKIIIKSINKYSDITN